MDGGGPINGAVNGCFVSGLFGSAQGVIGSFDLVGSGYSAVGIVAGSSRPTDLMEAKAVQPQEARWFQC